MEGAACGELSSEASAVCLCLCVWESDYWDVDGDLEVAVLVGSVDYAWEEAASAVGGGVVV